ncbi:hypothetical protein FRB99_005524 [Tulasnella sp. 403]|nr:hypothetical protein FRB99_005524 [Tulasnella sp. 403]
MATLDDLPVELLTDIFSLLDITDLVAISQVSRQTRLVCGDPLLNPWKPPITKLLRANDADLSSISKLGEISIFPRQNFIDILSLAPASFLLLHTALPALHSHHWEEVVNRRFLPSWRDARFPSPREQYMRLLWNVWHRENSHCTAQQAWCKYIVLARNGIVRLCSAYSRTYNPFTVFEDLKSQSNLERHPTEIRVVLRLADIRVLALGVLYRPDSFQVNQYAKMLLHPPGVETEPTVDLDDLAPGVGKGKTVGITEDTSAEIAAVESEEAVDQLPELQPSLSRDSGYSTSPVPGTPTMSRHGRSLSFAHSGSPVRGISIFRTRSLDEGGTNMAGPSSGSLNIMQLLRRRPRRASQTSPSSATNPSTPTSPTSPALPPTHPPVSPNPEPNDKPARGNILHSKASPYPLLRHPLPVRGFENYPNFTPGGFDQRCIGSGDDEEEGRAWVGPMLLTAQIIGPHDHGDASLEEILSHGRFAAFGDQDLFAIAPWIKDKITKITDGPGIGI